MPTSLRKFKKNIRRNPNVKRVLTEGDSWFHLPIGTNIVDHIEDLTNYNLLRTENSGDEIMQIMSGKQKVKLRGYLSKYDFDALLFSAGGNDIIGADMDELLRIPKGAQDDYYLIKERVDNKMKILECVYKDLIAIRDDYSPYTTIMVDCYDYIIPSDFPAKLFGIIPVSGPWVKPMLEAHKCNDLNRQKLVVKTLIDTFADMLQRLSEENERFVFVDTRGTIGENEWQDEIHPNKVASEKIAKIFIEEIQKLGD